MDQLSVPDYVRRLDTLLENVRVPLGSSNARERVMAIRHLAAGVQILEREVIAGARADSMSWEAIGTLYGVTKQGAQQRFRLEALG